MELYRLKIHEMKELIDKREISVEELTLSLIQRIEKTLGSVDNFITIDNENPLKVAKRVDGLLRKDIELSYLGGIPSGIQDNICTLGLKTTCGSRMLDNFIPPYDASVIQKLKKNHAIIMGKLSMDEFGGGSAVARAVAKGQVFCGLGSDTEGELRYSSIPYGLVGLKPTQGLVSSFGLVSCASSLESIGCIAKDVKDCANILEEITFYDHKDPTSLKAVIPHYSKNLVNDSKGLKIGIPKQVFKENWDSNVKSSIETALASFEKLGAQILEIDIPHLKYASSAHFIIMSAETSSNLARYDGIRYGYRTSEHEGLDMMYKETRTLGFGDEIKKRIMLGNLFLTSDYHHSHYLRALKIRTLLKEGFNSAFEVCNVILTPTRVKSLSKLNEFNRYTLLANMTGLPAISIPFGFDDDGFPMGIQLLADYLGEDLLLRSAYTLEANNYNYIDNSKGLEEDK